MDLSDLVLPLKEHQKYLSNLVQSQNNYTTYLDQGIPSELSQILPERSPKELAIHAIRPLAINLLNLEFSDKHKSKQELKQILEQNIVEMYKSIADLFQSTFDPKKDNNSSKFPDDRTKTRFSKLVQHCIHHMGQVILLAQIISKHYKTISGTYDHQM